MSQEPVNPATAARDESFRRAKLLVQEGRHGEAETILETLLRQAPNDANVLHELGLLALATNRPERAVDFLTNAATLAPGSAIAHLNLSTALNGLGRHEEALKACDRAIALKPDYALAHNNRANLLNLLKRHDEALASAEKAIALQPGVAEAINNRGNALQHLGRFDEAHDAYCEAVRLKPGYAEAFMNLGSVHFMKGDMDEAFAAYEKALALAPQRADFYRALVTTGHVGQASPYLPRMEELLGRTEPLPEREQMELHFALGAVYEEMGEASRAFRHFLDGNRIARRRIPYDEAPTLDMFRRIEAVFTRELMTKAKPTGASSKLPVFVIGMPRSGTTLVEQILSSHAEVLGAGEIPSLPNLVDAIEPAGSVAEFPEIFGELSRTRLRRLGEAYVEALRMHSPSARHVVDKLPGNFMRVGVIRLALSEAKIVHVRRDPIDTCLSCFTHLFTDPLRYTYDLAELGRYYRAYERLMAHWRSALPRGAMHEIRYEELIGDFEGETRRMLAYLELDWDERCLAFHRNRRPVKTASAAQVRRPLYASSVKRWHAYSELARPLLDALSEG